MVIKVSDETSIDIMPLELGSEGREYHGHKTCL